jgi:two-component system sensor histidine kinase ResE
MVTFAIGRWLFHALEQSSRRALNLERSRTDFLFAVAHQLKTPLSSLQVALQALKRERASQFTPGTPEARLLDVAIRSEERIGRQVNRLLEFFRIEAGQMELDLEPVSIATVIENVVEMVHPQMEAKRLRLAVQVPSALPDVTADEERIETVLVNLVQNAVDFTPVEGQITLTAQASNGTVVVKVSDTGPGVPASERSRIFEPFSRTSKTPVADQRGSWSGTGLGLAIAKSIVELHRGRIWAEQTSGKGISFCFSLPQDNRSQQS